MALFFLSTNQRGQGGLEAVFQPTGKSLLIPFQSLNRGKAD
jgi:hypothetical protein